MLRDDWPEKTPPSVYYAVTKRLRCYVTSKINTPQLFCYILITQKQMISSLFFPGTSEFNFFLNLEIFI